MTEVFKCPRCGQEMEIVHYKQAYWYECPACNLTTFAASTEEQARARACEYQKWYEKYNIQGGTRS